jgi:hypothetical protein
MASLPGRCLTFFKVSQIVVGNVQDDQLIQCEQMTGNAAEPAANINHLSQLNTLANHNVMYISNLSQIAHWRSTGTSYAELTGGFSKTPNINMPCSSIMTSTKNFRVQSYHRAGSMPLVALLSMSEVSALQSYSP